MDILEKLNSLSGSDSHKNKVKDEIKYCYFKYIVPIIKLYSQSENFNANKDLISIRHKLENQSYTLGLKSTRILEYLSKNDSEKIILNKTNLTEEDILTLRNGILKKFLFIEDAALIISLILDKRSEMYLKWYISIVITIIGFIIGLMK